MADKKKKNIPLWIQVVAILMVGIIASVGTYLFVKDKNTERFTVTFAYSDGGVIEKKEVKSGKGVIPPDYKTDFVFRGWNGIINNISDDKEVHPVIYRIVEDNLFYFDSVYVREGRTFTIDLMLAGKVNINDGEITLKYDQEVMKYINLESSETFETFEIRQNTPGELTINFDSKDILKEKTNLAQIKFYAKRKDVQYSQITLSAKETNVVINGEKTPADCATINNNIYFLQEV